MGTVYVAEDTKLKREVAIKLLPPEVVTDPNSRRRFQREAEAVAALDHPNIVSIYSIESAAADQAVKGEPVQFITMQLVEGTTLGDQIPPDGLSLDQFFELSLPLTDAVSAAHQKGVIHRDLKPSNIMVGADGRVRILDFGLAKLVQPEVQGDVDPELETRTAALTLNGHIVGTVPYMSPETARGLPADARSDIFALGVIFHEMLSGRRPFQGDSVAELLSAILRDVPESVSDLRSQLPPRLGRIVCRCLEKNPDQRYQSGHELYADLRELKNETASGDAADSVARVGPSQDRQNRSGDVGSGNGSLPAKPSLAVLPFVSLSGGADQDYFAEGLSADINSDLVKLSGLFLISQTTTQLYAKKEIDPRGVGEELGVRHILTGTVRKAADRIRITAQLVDTQTAVPLWADRFDGSLDDLFALQDEITERIVTALDVELVHGEAARMTRRSLRNPQARDLFYRGFPYVFSDQQVNLHVAQRLMREAAQLEPESPIPPSFAAWSHYWEARLDLSDSPAASIATAVALADRAIELDDPSGLAYMLKGTIHLAQREHELAWEASERALEHRPSCPWAYVLKGNICNYIGKPAQAIDLAKQAIRLTPLFPPLFPAVLATGHYLCEQPEMAIEASRRAIELAPKNLDVQVILAAALVSIGQTDEAARILHEIHQNKPGFSTDEYAKGQPFKDQNVIHRLIGDLCAGGTS